MLVICCGMQRSGSTLQYQIACAVAERAGVGRGVGWDWPNATPEMAVSARPVHVLKVHQPNDTFELTLDPAFTRYLYCHRDVRDVVVSLIDKTGPMDDDRLVNELKNGLIGPYNAFVSRPGALVSRYEDMINDLPGEVRRIAQTIGVTVHETDVADIADGLRLENQKAFIGGRDWSDGRAWDGRTLLHRNHIADGLVGKWRERLSERQIAIIEQHAGGWLRARGYESVSLTPR